MKKKNLSKAKTKLVKKSISKTRQSSTAEVSTVKLRSEAVHDHTVHRVLPKKKGFGVATKFSIFVAILLALIISGGQYWAYILADERLSNEIDNQGILLCHTLIGGGSEFLLGLDKPIDSNQENQTKSKLGDLLVNATSTNPMLTDILRSILFTQPNESGNDAVLFGTPVNITFQRETSMKGVLRSEAFLSGDTRVRRYVLKAPDSAYKIEVFLKAERLDNLKRDMLKNTFITTLVSLLVGIVGTAFLASKVASPIKVLAQDMLKVASGDLGYRTRVKASGEVSVLAQTFNMMGKDLEISHRAELEKIELDRDLALAHDVQESLLPKTIPNIPGYQVQPFYRSAKDVGGDYYDVLAIDKEHVAFVVADVAGKGTQGAMIMAMTRGITRSYLASTTSPAAALAKVNISLAQDLKPGSFVTALCAVLNIRTGKLSVASAGHNPLILVRHKKTSCEIINPPGIALGFDKGPLFNKNIKSCTFQFRVGDRMVIYTDGVVEAMNEQHEEYGDKRFQSFCVRHTNQDSKTFVQELVSSLDDHKGGAPQHDDITILTLRKMS